MRKLLLLAALLAGCGADGPPVAPEPRRSGVTITGEARAGVVFRP
jgi:hypothetical protein